MSGGGVLGCRAWTGAVCGVWALCRSLRREKSSEEGATSAYLAQSTSEVPKG